MCSEVPIVPRAAVGWDVSIDPCTSQQAQAGRAEQVHPQGCTTTTCRHSKHRYILAHHEPAPHPPPARSSPAPGLHIAGGCIANAGLWDPDVWPQHPLHRRQRPGLGESPVHRCSQGWQEMPVFSYKMYEMPLLLLRHPALVVRAYGEGWSQTSL